MTSGNMCYLFSLPLWLVTGIQFNTNSNLIKYTIGITRQNTAIELYARMQKFCISQERARRDVHARQNT